MHRLAVSAALPLPLLDSAEQIAGGIAEPGDVARGAAEDPPSIGLETGEVLDLDTTLDQRVDGGLDVAHRQI